MQGVYPVWYDHNSIWSVRDLIKCWKCNQLGSKHMYWDSLIYVCICSVLSLVRTLCAIFIGHGTTNCIECKYADVLINGFYQTYTQNITLKIEYERYRNCRTQRNTHAPHRSVSFQIYFLWITMQETSSISFIYWSAKCFHRCSVDYQCLNRKITHKPSKSFPKRKINGLMNI